LQDYHLDYHLRSWTFKVLFILNFSFSSSFFAITLWFSLNFQLLAFSIEILFSLYWVSLIALQFLTCWWSLFRGILGNKLLFFGSKRVQWKHIFKSFFLDKKKMVTHHFKSWLPHSLQRVNSVTKTNGIKHISLFIFVCVYNSLFLLPLSFSLSLFLFTFF